MSARRFHIVHYFPTEQWHGLRGYAEVIESLVWGLQELGYSAEVGGDVDFSGPTNILFGAHMLPLETIAKLPEDTIYYNMEPMIGLDTRGYKESFRLLAKKVQIWDYSPVNLPMWLEIGASNPKHFPVSYAPILTKIPTATPRDIDVLIYGLPGPQRVQAFVDACHRGLKCAFVCGLYGESRDSLIARSKIVLNINLYEHARIFEEVRVTYLLANHKAVVADMHPNTTAAGDMQAAVAFAPLQQIGQLCQHLIARPDELAALEQRGFEAFSRRDIRTALSEVLA